MCMMLSACWIEGSSFAIDLFDLPTAGWRRRHQGAHAHLVHLQASCCSCYCAAHRWAAAASRRAHTGAPTQPKPHPHCPSTCIMFACPLQQVGGGGIKAHTHTRAPMTMGEVLEVMLAKARVEAEDAQVRLGSINGRCFPCVLVGLQLGRGAGGDACKGEGGGGGCTGKVCRVY